MPQTIISGRIVFNPKNDFQSGLLATILIYEHNISRALRAHTHTWSNPNEMLLPFIT